MPAQGKFIDSLNRFLKAKDMPLMLNQNGICSGLVIKYLVECAKDNKHEFFEQLNTTAKMSRAEYSTKETVMKIASRDLEYAHRPHFYQARVRQRDLNIISAIFKFPTENKFDFGYTFTIDSLEEALKQIVNNGDMIRLISLNHAIGLYKKDGKYYLYNPNYDEDIEEDKMFNNTAELAKEIFQCFNVPIRKPPPALQSIGFSVFRPKSTKNWQQEEVKYPVKNQLIEKLMLVDRNKSVDSNQQKTQSLQMACMMGDRETAEVLLKANANPLIENERNYSALSLAATYGNKELLNMIFDNSNFKITNRDINNSLYATMISENVDEFKNLLGRLDHDSIIPLLKSDTLIYSACTRLRSDMLNTIMSYLDKSDENILINKYGQDLPPAQYPLTLAAAKGSSSLISYLLTKDIVKNHGPSIKDSLIAAIQNKHEHIAVQLLPYYKGEFDSEIVSLAINKNCHWVINSLLERTEYNIAITKFSDVINSSNERLITSYIKQMLNKNPQEPEIYQLKFIDAILQNDAEQVETLIRKHGQVIFNDNMDYAIILALSFRLNKQNVIKKLLTNADCKLALKRIDKLMLSEVCEAGNPELVNLILHHIKFNDADLIFLNSIFKRAVKENDIDTIKALLYAGANPLAPIDEEHRTALDLAILNRSQFIILEILEVYTPDKINQLPNKYAILEKLFSAAIRNGFKELLPILIFKYKINASMPINYNSETFSPLELAAKFEQKESIYFLLNRRVDINLGNKTKERLLLLACKTGDTALIQLLKQNGYIIPAVVDIDFKSFSLIDYAMQEKQPQVINQLIIDGVIPQNKTDILVWAFENGFNQLFSYLLNTFKDIKIDNEALIAIWHKHIKQNDLTWIQQSSAIIKQVLSPEILQNENYNAILHAIQQNQGEMVKLLYPFITNEKLREKILETTVTMQQPELFDFMLKNGAKFSDKKKHLPAIDKMYKPQLMFLDDERPSLQLPIPPPLQIAYKMGHINTLHYVCNAIKLSTFEGEYLPQDFAELSRFMLNYATQSKDTNIAFNLLKHGAIIYKPGNQTEKHDKTKDTGYQLLCRACIIGDLALIKLLLEKGVPHTELPDPQDPNPIEIAALFGHEHIVKFLSEQYRNTLDFDIKKLLFLTVKLNDWHLTTALLELMPTDVLLSIGITKLLLPHQEEIKNHFLTIMAANYNEAVKNNDEIQQNNVFTRMSAVSKKLNALGVLLHTPKSQEFQQYSPYTDEFGMPITSYIAQIRESFDTLNKRAAQITRPPSPKS